MSGSQTRLANLVDRPITFKNVEEVVHTVVNILLEHDVSIRRGDAERTNSRGRLESAEAQLTEVRRVSFVEELRKLNAALGQERELRAKEAKLTQVELDQLRAQLAAVEQHLQRQAEDSELRDTLDRRPQQQQKHFTNASSASAISPAMMHAADRASALSPTALYATRASVERSPAAEGVRDRLESLEEKQREQHRELADKARMLMRASAERERDRKAETESLRLRADKLERELADLRQRTAERSELAELEKRLQQSKLSALAASSPAHHVQLNVSSGPQGGSGAGGEHNAFTAQRRGVGSALAEPSAVAAERLAEPQAQQPAPTLAQMRKVLAEFELLRMAQAQNQTQLLTLQLQVGRQGGRPQGGRWQGGRCQCGRATRAWIPTEGSRRPYPAMCKGLIPPLGMAARAATHGSARHPTRSLPHPLFPRHAACYALSSYPSAAVHPSSRRMLRAVLLPLPFGRAASQVAAHFEGRELPAPLHPLPRPGPPALLPTGTEAGALAGGPEVAMRLLLEETLPALRAQLEAHEGMIRALAQTKADALKVETALVCASGARQGSLALEQGAPPGKGGPISLASDVPWSGAPYSPWCELPRASSAPCPAPHARAPTQTFLLPPPPHPFPASAHAHPGVAPMHARARRMRRRTRICC
jgi:hypothetical protein